MAIDSVYQTDKRPVELVISIKNAHVRVLRGSREGKGQLIECDVHRNNNIGKVGIETGRAFMI